MPYRSLPEPARTVGAVLETQSFNPLRSGRNHLRALASAAGIPTGGSTRCSSRWASAGGRTERRDVLALACASGSGSARRSSATRRILILDEPANGLDGRRGSGGSGTSCGRGFAAHGNGVLVSSHVLTEMAQLADEAIVISRGRLVGRAPVPELTSGRVGSRGSRTRSSS